jgi:hypothetical protein
LGKLNFLIYPDANKTTKAKKNQRNHRVPKNLHNNRQPCPRSVDCTGHRGVPTYQFSRWCHIPHSCTNRHIWSTQVFGLPATCYNCKKCTFGLGRLAALYFGKRSLKDYKYNYHLPTAIFFYALIGPLPAAIRLIYTIQAVTALKMAVLIILLALSVFSDLTWHTTNKK